MTSMSPLSRSFDATLGSARAIVPGMSSEKTKLAALTAPLQATPKHAINGYCAWDIAAQKGQPAWAISGWVCENDQVVPTPHIILPHAEASIAVHQRGDNMHLLMCGPAQAPRVHKPSVGERLIGISLTPETMARCFRLHPPEWEQKVELAPPNLARSLEPAVESMRILPGREALKALLTAVAAIVDKSEMPVSAEHYLAQQMRARDGDLRLSGLGEQLHLSSRQTRRRFIGLMGITPKTFARQLRLARIMTRADHHRSPAWAGLAHESGYCDQAHFVRDCRALTGRTPSQIHANRQLQQI